MQHIIPSRNDLENSNPVDFSHIDYVNYIMNLSKSPYNVIQSFKSVFFPDFEIINGMAFNISFGCRDKYASNLKKGMSESDAYYWAHVIDVGGTFLICDDDASEIADYICIGWNLSLKNINFTKVSFSKEIGEEVLVFPITAPS